MASINVKVPTKKVIVALEKRLKQIQDKKAAHEQYQKDAEAWHKSLTSLDPTGWKVANTRVLSSYRNGKQVLEIEYEVPKSVVSSRPKEVEGLDWHERNAIEELENAIRILKMTDEEVVSASTFKAVSKFL